MKYLFLDLEDTLITPVFDGWGNCELINIEKIKNIIEKENPDTINVFSFAIHTKEDKKEFEEICKPMIEKVYGIKISHYPTVSEIIDVCSLVSSKNNKMKKSVSFQELRRFWGKSGAFKIYVKGKFKSRFGPTTHPQEFILLDDDVENESFSYDDHLIAGKLINIDKINSNMHGF